MEPRITKFLTAVGVLAAALALVACGDKTLNAGDAEKKIADEVQQQQGYEPEKVECPDEMKAEKGETYECKVSAPGGREATAEIEMLDDEGRFRFEVPPPS